MTLGAAFLPAGPSDKVCLDISPAGASGEENEIGHIMFAATPASYYLFLPYLYNPQNGDGEPIYDMHIDIVTDSCEKDKRTLNPNILVNPVDLPNKELNPNISI